MSDLITHWAVYDDAARLAALDARVSPFFLEILRDDAESARIGAVTRWGKIWVSQLLHKYRDLHRENGEFSPRDRQKLAFALGGLLHYPADFVFKPVFSRLANFDWNKAHHLAQAGHADSLAPHREISAYYDLEVFKKVYLNGEAEPFTRFLLERNSTSGGQALEAFMRAMFHRATLSAHTYRPIRNDIEAWLDGLFDAMQPLYLQIELYTRIWENPDPQKIAEYEVETSFYRDSDPLLQLARAAQAGQSIEQNALDAALEIGANQSNFAEAVRLGVLVLREATDFWNGQTDTPPDVSQG